MMEEKILEIIKTQWPFHPEKRAKEITAHIFEFIHWKDFGQNPFIDWFDEEGEFYTDEVSEKRFTIEDLYEYWLTNIKK